MATIEETASKIDSLIEDFNKKIIDTANECDENIWLLPASSGHFAFNKKIHTVCNPFFICISRYAPKGFESDIFKLGGKNQKEDK